MNLRLLPNLLHALQNIKELQGTRIWHVPCSNWARGFASQAKLLVSPDDLGRLDLIWTFGRLDLIYRL